MTKIVQLISNSLLLVQQGEALWQDFTTRLFAISLVVGVHSIH